MKSLRRPLQQKRSFANQCRRFDELMTRNARSQHDKKTSIQQAICKASGEKVDCFGLPADGVASLVELSVSVPRTTRPQIAHEQPILKESGSVSKSVVIRSILEKASLAAPAARNVMLRMTVLPARSSETLYYAAIDLVATLCC
jgi:hypothetical protein